MTNPSLYRIDLLLRKTLQKPIFTTPLSPFIKNKRLSRFSNGKYLIKCKHLNQKMYAFHIPNGFSSFSFFSSFLFFDGFSIFFFFYFYSTQGVYAYCLYVCRLYIECSASNIPYTSWYTATATYSFTHSRRFSRHGVKFSFVYITFSYVCFSSKFSAFLLEFI